MLQEAKLFFYDTSYAPALAIEQNAKKSPAPDIALQQQVYFFPALSLDHSSWIKFIWFYLKQYFFFQSGCNFLMRRQMGTRERWCVKILINVCKVLWNSKVQFKRCLLLLIMNTKSEQEPQRFSWDPTHPYTEMAQVPRPLPSGGCGSSRPGRVCFLPPLLLVQGSRREMAGPCRRRAPGSVSLQYMLTAIFFLFPSSVL